MVLGTFAVSNAQQFDYQGTIVGKTSDATTYHNADIDDDGDEDIVLAGYGRLVWMENDGAGKFLKEHVIWKVVDFNPTKIEIADVNGDDNPDVLARFNDGAGRLYQFINDGQGGFSNPTEVYSNSYLGEFALSDLDGDLDLDLVVIIENPIDVLRFYENDGAGNFSYVTYINGFGDGVNFVACGDVGGSALADVVASVIVEDKVVWFENLGGWSFSTENMVSTDHDYPRKIVVADLNGDTDNDIIVSSFLDEELAWFENLGSGTFSTQNIILNSSEEPEFIVADMDGDTDLDLITNTGPDEAMVLHTNDGSANFAAPVQISTRDPHYYFGAFDVNNDTYVDVFYAPFGSPNRGSSYFIKNNSNTGFATEEFLTYGLTDCQAFQYADVDGDGWQDIISTSSTDNTIFLSRNLGDGTFDVPTIVSDTVQLVYSIQVVDLDNDLDMDLLAVARGYSNGTYNNRIHVFENDGNGNLSFVTYLALNAGIQEQRFAFVNTADIDGNEYQDVLVTSYDNNNRRIHQFLNNGGFSFSGITTAVQFFTEVQFVEFADMNGDTLPDLVFLEELSGELKYRENDGNGGFPNEVEINLPSGVSSFTKGLSLEVVDMDGDQDNDILISLRQNYSTTSQGNMKLLYLLNDGNANFNSHVYVDETYGIAWDTEAADIDGDTDIDIVVNDIYGTSWYRNDGGTFVLEVIDSVSTGLIIQGAVVSNRSLQLVDLDNDTDLDVVYTAIVDQFDKRYLRWAKNGAVNCAVLPTVASSTSTAVCEEVPVTLTATGGSIFTWNNGLADQASHVVQPEETTTYVVTVSDGTNCTFTDSVTVEILEAPVATVDLVYPNLETQTFDSYQWLLDGTELTGETDQTILPVTNGDYSVIVTDNSTGCSDTSSVYNLLTVDVLDSDSQQLSVYPNPTNGAIRIALSNSSGQSLLKVFNMNGKLIHEEQQANQTSFELQLPEESGIYLVQLTSSKGLNSTLRVIKE